MHCALIVGIRFDLSVSQVETCCTTLVHS